MNDQERPRGEEIVDVVWDPEKEGEEKTFAGIFASSSSFNSKLDPTKLNTVYKFLDSEGDTITVFGSAILNRRMCTVKPGSYVTLQYLGRKGTSSTSAKLFKVFVDAPSEEEIALFKNAVPF